MLSYRQAEWLLDIRDEAQTVTDHRGYSIRHLLTFCYENHLDLNEDDEDWLMELRKSGRMSVRKHEAIRLHRLARQLGLEN